MPEWLPTLATVLGAGLASYVGVRVALAELRVQMVDVREWVKELRKRSHGHTNRLLIHDGEIGEIMRKLEMQRFRQRPLDEKD